ncbi:MULTISPECIES: hypothetical protein [unclassified Caballeronia]|uniref:hypothetical protein n=1 Tax=unclassified Caballeronia TaxID=2646786 RepID=UPI00285CDDA4|nr:MULTISPECIES: hypothetical protein [unclassified Caballeronia]MDR5771508.1 hypothetical protein [Caballeronia sp. LZ002]MDR5800070.1 hypothetical protein [Caballeronia sp. LZ001]MDR5805270.1 hypothetical protein [Caballeronia sp. LZ001]MDR5846944.1 hypothetical protein [Caballeronia sp. LZ003]
MSSLKTQFEYAEPVAIGMNTAGLNESATLFRRRYHANGSHAGFILYLDDPSVDPEDVDAICQPLRESKKLGNFRHLSVHSASRDSNGNKGSLELIPISEVAPRMTFRGGLKKK